MNILTLKSIGKLYLVIDRQKIQSKIYKTYSNQYIYKQLIARKCRN